MNPHAMTPLPGVEPFDAELESQLEAARSALGPAYEPRTHFVTPDGRPKYTNRLLLETSPYLLQHAHNPMNWFSWGDEAFDQAKALGRPVLLSVGYSTCHWCHVMEVESFEDEEIAAYVNSHFIAIKVDREERPDVDSVYMHAVQLYTGQGGWPMTVMLTPDRTPFFGGTYFPPRDGVRGASIGFLTLLQRVVELYTERPERVAETAKQFSEAMKRAAEPAPRSGVPDAGVLVDAARQLAARFDERWGGFDSAPKFPRPSAYELLLRYWRRTHDDHALHMVKRSADAMSAGGLRDHVGGGFHRYSTDERWLVPHFEKMLYDNAQLVVLFLELYQCTHEERYASVARDTLDYVAREMTSAEGGFYSATDADSEGEEGLFFVWTPQQLQDVLGDELGRTASVYYGVTERGNFEGKNILERWRPLGDVAAELGIGVGELLERMHEARAKLYDAREQRVHPLLDDKIIVEWNGQMISAFSRAAFVFDDDGYLARAEKAAKFILAAMRDARGRLCRTYRGGPKHAGMLEDYAFFISGLLDLFDASQRVEWLDAAIELQTLLERHFAAPAGGFYATPDDAESLLVREKPTYDGAQPSGNSVAVLNLLRLAELTEDERYRDRGERALESLGGALDRGASGSPKLVTALDFLLDKPKQVVIVTSESVIAEPLLAEVRKVFSPNRVLVVVSETQIDRVKERLPLVAAKKMNGGLPTAYVCTAGACDRPTTDPAELAAQLKTVAPLGREVAPLARR